mgnify:FL=1
MPGYHHKPKAVKIKTEREGQQCEMCYYPVVMKYETDTETSLLCTRCRNIYLIKKKEIKTIKNNQKSLGF